MQKKKIVILLGPPGAGKGTISGKIEQDFGWKKLVTGNLCRQHIQDQTDLGVQIKEIISQGGLISDEMMLTMVKNWMQDNQSESQGFIFDGMPRTLNQAQYTHDMLKNKFAEFTPLIVQLYVEKDVVLQRILSRLICSNKDCQAVFSASSQPSMQPKKNMICDICGCTLKHRLDDTEQAVKKRLDDYYQYEKDMVNYYKSLQVRVYTVDANQPVDKVFETIKKIANT